ARRFCHAWRRRSLRSRPKRGLAASSSSRSKTWASSSAPRQRTSGLELSSRLRKSSGVCAERTNQLTTSKTPTTALTKRKGTRKSWTMNLPEGGTTGGNPPAASAPEARGASDGMNRKSPNQMQLQRNRLILDREQG